MEYPHVMVKDGITHIDGACNPDHVIVNDEIEEMDARAKGYQSPLDGDDAGFEELADLDTGEAPKRRGRPPKVRTETEGE